jgi:hypothetical protein
MAGALLLGGSLVEDNQVLADGCSDKQDEADGGKTNFKTVMVNGRKTIVIDKPFVVCGKVPRPNVIYVLQATAINYEWENLKQDFLPKIRQSVKKAPF